MKGELEEWGRLHDPLRSGSNLYKWKTSRSERERLRQMRKIQSSRRKLRTIFLKTTLMMKVLWKREAIQKMVKRLRKSLTVRMMKVTIPCR